MKFIMNQALMTLHNKAFWFLYSKHLCDFKSLFFIADKAEESNTLLFVLAQDGNLYRLAPKEKSYSLNQVFDNKLYLSAILEARHACAEYPTISHALLTIERNTKFFSNKKN